MAGDVELLARALVAQVLTAHDWAQRLDGICRNMREAAAHPHPDAPHPVETMKEVAERAASMLRDIAAADPLTVGRLYFDVLPRDAAHPLTAAIIAAFSDGEAVMRLLKDSGTQFQMQKDEAGVNYITVHDLDHADGLGDAFKAAVIRALAMTARVGRPPQGGLHSVH